MKCLFLRLFVWMFVPVLLGTGLFGARFQGLAAENVDPVSLKAELAALRKQYKLPGLAILVFDTHKILAHAVVGQRLRGKKTKLTIQDQFHLGSCSKAMTATLLAILVEEGQLRWDTRLGEVFPEYRTQMKGAWAQMTLEQFLSHRSGTPENLERDGLWHQLWQRKGSPRQQRLQLLQGVIKHPPLFSPGSQFLYSNAGFALAGAMAEKVTGQAWEQLMTQRIFQPLGMTSAGFGPPGTLTVLNQPWGHKSDGVPVPPDQNGDNPPGIGPSGNVHASLIDWAKFARIHLLGEQNGWVVNGKQVLSAHSYQKLHTPVGADYALGWRVAQRSWAEGMALNHAGTNNAWFAVNWLALKKGMGFLVATNQGGAAADQALEKAAFAAIQRYIEPF